MDVIELQRKYSDFRKSLHEEGYLGDQLKQLQQMEDVKNRDFLKCLYYNFFKDTEMAMGELAKTWNPENQDFQNMDYYLHQIHGSICSLGTQRFEKVVLAFRDFCTKQDINRCSKCLVQLENEYTLVKERLETLFKLEDQILAVVDQFLRLIILMKSQPRAM